MYEEMTMTPKVPPPGAGNEPVWLSRVRCTRGDSQYTPNDDEFRELSQIL